MIPHQTALPDVFLPHMPDVARCELSLHELNQMWRLIEASARMNCPAEARLLLPAMVATRTGFAHLEQALVANLVQEKVSHVLAGIGTQARYAIEILVRNLFERTADVGFLATDAELCRFVAGAGAGLDPGPGAESTPAKAGAGLAQARRRLSDYRDKYTVYDDILLLDPAGRVLVQADTAQPVTRSADPLLARTLAADGYLETFRATDLRPGKARALVYSHRMRDPASGEVVGVLCLCFNFEQEMAAIFDAYRDPSQRANMLLLDADDRVIISADPLWIPAGARVPTNCAGKASLLMFGGREYLVRTFTSNGYQGYPGPAGWKGQLMIPVELAFRGGGADALSRFDARLLQGLLSHAHSFSPALHELMSSVTRTTRTIERIVWNGKVTSVAGPDADTDNAGSADSAGISERQGRLNTVLDQITDTGARSDALFSRSIQDLYQTVLTSSMREAAFTSQLLVDMLDRNLYERANDCRWWALTAQLRHGLAQATGSAGADRQTLAGMRAVLEQINGLYTVYHRLFVYDRSGRIVATSGTQHVVGRQVDADTLARVVALRGELDHYPQPFAPSPLYDGQPTFIYHAAVRHPGRPDQCDPSGQSGNVVGGIGIVFDATPELRNMLAAGVDGRPAMQAYFVTPDGQVLASTDPACPPGAVLALEAGLVEGSRIVAHGGQYAIAACTGATGYREFRRGLADHREPREQPVLAVLLESFGALRTPQQLAADAGAASAHQIDARADSGPEFALFYAGGTLMAMPATAVQEAVPFARVQKAAGGHPARLGMLDVESWPASTHFVWVFDLSMLVSGRAGAMTENSQVMLVRHGAATIGLLVDDLHSVQRFDPADMTPSPLLHAGDGAAAGLSTRLIKANQGRLLIQEIGVAALFARLRAGAG